MLIYSSDIVHITLFYEHKFWSTNTVKTIENLTKDPNVRARDTGSTLGGKRHVDPHQLQCHSEP